MLCLPPQKFQVPFQNISCANQINPKNRSFTDITSPQRDILLFQQMYLHFFFFQWPCNACWVQLVLYETKITSTQKIAMQFNIYRHYSTACFPFRLILVSRLLLYYHPQLNQRRILTNLRRRLSKLVSHENIQFVAFFGTKESSFYNTTQYDIIQFIYLIV